MVGLPEIYDSIRIVHENAAFPKKYVLEEMGSQEIAEVTATPSDGSTWTLAARSVLHQSVDGNQQVPDSYEIRLSYKKVAGDTSPPETQIFGIARELFDLMYRTRQDQK